MKKIIGILGVAVIAVAMFFSANNVNSSNSDTSLASLITMNTANAEPDEETGSGCTFLKEKQTSQQLVCTSVNGTLAISAGLTVGVVKNNVTASAAAKAQCTWELRNCFVVYCYPNSGSSCCTPIPDWTICATGGC